MNYLKLIVLLLVLVSLLTVNCSDSDECLCPDPVEEPNEIADLEVGLCDLSSIVIHWTAPKEAITYDIRYSTTEITDANWSSATQVQDEPTPKDYGAVEMLKIDGLDFANEYFFAIKFQIDATEWSTLSNVADGITLLFDVRGKLAYASEMDGDYEIYIMNADGSDKKQLTHNSTLDYYPKWTANGTSIVYNAKIGSYNQITLVDLISDEITNISNSDYDEFSPSVLFPSNRIAFCYRTDPHTDHKDIYTMNLDGTSKIPFLSSDTCSDNYPAWSPDGSKIIFFRITTGFTMGIYVKGVSDPTEQKILDVSAGQISWSPDGTKFVAIVSNDIIIYNADGSNPTNLTNGSYTCFSPDWSPDGSKIAFVIHDGNDTEIYTINPDGTGLTQITDNDYADNYPCWSPFQ